MQVGDLVKWRGSSSRDVFTGPRIGIVLGRWENPHPDDTTAYWSVFMEGQTYNMDEQYLKVIHESR